jgi:hypothetical protein
LPPPVEGLDAEVLNFDDRIQLRDNGDEAIVVRAIAASPASASSRTAPCPSTGARRPPT